MPHSRANPATTCAFRRGEDVVVVVTTRDEPADVDRPAGTWRNVLGRARAAVRRFYGVYERVE